MGQATKHLLELDTLKESFTTQCGSFFGFNAPDSVPAIDGRTEIGSTSPYTVKDLLTACEREEKAVAKAQQLLEDYWKEDHSGDNVCT